MIEYKYRSTLLSYHITQELSLPVLTFSTAYRTSFLSVCETSNCFIVELNTDYFTGWIANVALQPCFTTLNMFFSTCPSPTCVFDVCYSCIFVCTDKTYSKLLLYPLHCAEYTFHMSYANIQNQQVIRKENWFILILCIKYIYICTYMYLCICIYDMNTPLLRSYWDTHPTYAYLKKSTGVTGVSPGLSIVDVAASASYVNFTDQVKQNEGG